MFIYVCHKCSVSGGARKVFVRSIYFVVVVFVVVPVLLLERKTRGRSWPSLMVKFTRVDLRRPALRRR
jgi:hypothetical protein